MTFLNSLLYYFFFFFINLDLIAMTVMAVGLVLLFSKRFVLGRKMLAVFTLVFLVINISPLGPWMIMKLENMVTRPSELPKDVDGIIMLGGAFALRETQERGHAVYNKAGPRFLEYVELAHRYPHAKIILTGNAIEAKYGEEILLSLGISKNRLIIDNNSRGTEDHPKKLENLLDKSKKYMLVTSAFHMPRGLLLFQGSGYNVVPFPVDYQTPGKMSMTSWMAYVLQRLTPMAFKQAWIEWAGLTTYYVNGLTKTWYP